MSQTTRLVLIRHGRTAWNRQSGSPSVRFRGQANPPLDAVGRRQAAATARYVARRWPVDAVYASPLRRAMETARAVAQAGNLSARALEALLDIDFGRWEGHSPEEVKRRYPELVRTWFEAPQTVQIPGGERLDDVLSRAVGGLGAVVERHPGETVATVGHTVVNRVLLCAFLGMGNEGFWRLRQDTCAVNVFDVDAERKAIVVVLNDTSHLVDVAGGSAA